MNRFARLLLMFEIQDFTIRARILNFVGGMARSKRFSGESGREPRRIFKDNANHQRRAPLGRLLYGFVRSFILSFCVFVAFTGRSLFFILKLASSIYI